MNPIQSMIHENVSKYGLAIQYIFPTSEEDGPAFIYTVGLTNLGLPEWIVFGLSPDLMMPIINQMFAEIKAGERDATKSEFDDVASVVFRNEAVHLSHAKEYAVQCMEYYRGTRHKPTFNQLVWPDEKGLFPDQEGFSERFKKHQPYLPGFPVKSNIYNFNSLDR